MLQRIDRKSQMKHSMVLWLLVLLVGLGQATVAMAAEGDDLPNKMASVTLYVENDLVAGTDEYYTSGVRLSYLSPDIEALPAYADWMRRWVPILDRPGYTNNVGLAIGQNIYTPVDTRVSGPQPNDRPYAGWLYGSLSLHHKSDHDLHKLELTLGIVGPESMGEGAQNTIHDLRNFRRANGWDNQLDTEPGIIIAYDYRRRYEVQLDNGPWGADFIPTAGGSVGNVLTEARSGATVRFGWNVPRDFQSQRITVAGYTQAPNPEAYAGRDRAFSAFLFAGLLGRAVAHNIFLDGNTFGDSPSVDRREFVGELEVGAGLRYGRWRGTYTQVYSTEEFYGQVSGQQYGSLALSVSF
jgi:lipid A 3-O-deacylase